MAGFSFTTGGATPNLANSAQAKNLTGISLNPLATPKGQLALSSPGFANSPAAKALNNVQATTPAPASPAPTTPVKSTTTNNVDGSSHTTTYHAPTPGLIAPQPTAAKDATTYGQNIVDTSGNAGVAKFDAMTGKPLQDPSAPAPTPTTPATTTPAPTTPAAGTFPGMVNTLSTSAQNGSASEQQNQADTAKYGAGNIPIGQNAADIAANYGKQISDVGKQGAAFESGQLTTGTSPVAEGNAAVTAQTTAAQQQALATGEAAALQGTGQQLTAQNQAAGAANQAAGQANTAQGTSLSGINSAAALAQPSATAQGQTTFDPLTGKFTGGSYQQNMQTVVDAIKNGSIGYTDGVNSLSGLSPTAKADVLAALGQGFDTVASDANAAAKGSNIQTLGTAETQGQAQVEATLAPMRAASTAADGIQSTINNFLDQNPDLNSNSAALANAAQQWISGKQLTDPKYQSLFNYLNEYTSTLAPVLGVGGDTTNLKTEIAQGFVNSRASGASIKSVIANMSQLAQDKIKNIRSGASGGGVVAGGTSPGTPGSTNTGTVQTQAGAVNTNW